MNVYKYLPKDHFAVTENLTAAVYMFLLSRVVVEEENLYSYYTRNLTQRTFPEQDIEAALEELENRGVITSEAVDGFDETDRFLLGAMSGKKVILQQSKENQANLYVMRVRETLKEQLSGTKSTMKKAELVEYLNHVENALLAQDVKTVTGFWVACYYCYFMEHARDFLQKEYGQIKTLLKLFSGVMVLAMIAEYMRNSEKYCKNGTPTVGHLLVLRDLVASNVTKVSKVTAPKPSKEGLRIRKESEF